MNIVIEYDASAANAPAGFKQAVEAAVQFFDYLIVNPITVPIVFSYGEIQGQTISRSAAAESSTNGNIETFSSVVSLLTAAATSATDQLAIANLAKTDPTNGGRFWVSDAQARVFGLSSQPGYTDPEDGFVGISSRLNFSWDPTRRAVAGAYDAIGALEHEIAEVLGRYDYLAGSLTFSGYNLYAPLDLFRYTATGARTVAYSSGFFSIDGGKTLQLPFNNPNNGGDAGDWASSVMGDSFGGASSGMAGYLSPTDLQVMDVLGYQIAPLGQPVAGAAPVLSATSSAPASIAISALTSLITNDYLGALTVVSASLDPAYASAGALTINAANQTVAFTPAPGFAGTATATVTISDNNGGSVRQPINFTVAGGSVTNLGAAAATVTLTSASQIINGGAGAATINATATTAGALLKGGSGPMTLNVSGGGVVTMNAGDTGVGAVNLLASSNPYAFTASAGAGMVINDLSGSADTITVGAASQTVNGGPGAVTVNATAATAGVLLKGGAGPITLKLSGGGVATMNAADTGVGTVSLLASALGYAFTASAGAGMVINDLSSGADTITAGGPQQTITGGAAGKLTMVASAAGGDTFRNTAAAFNGDTISGFAAANDIIDVTNLTASKLTATFVENAGGASGQLNLSDGTRSTTITLVGAFMPAGFNGTAAAAGFTAVSDGAGGTNITYAAPIPSNVTNLGAAAATVTLTSASQIINGGAGAATINATAATAGALLRAGSGPMTLNVSGGGVVTMNAADTGVRAVNLQASNSAYAFTASAGAGMVITDLSSGADTITAGGPLQTITGGGAGKLTMTASPSGGDTFRNTAAVFNGDTIIGFAAPNDIIDVTNLNPAKLTATFVENALGTSGRLNLSDGAHSASITLFGQFMAAGFSGSAAAAGFTATSDGAGGTNISYSAAVAPPHSGPKTHF